MSNQNQRDDVLTRVLNLLREAGLDRLVTNIEVFTNADGSKMYRVDHTGTDEDEAAINGAFGIVLADRSARST